MYHVTVLATCHHMKLIIIVVVAVGHHPNGVVVGKGKHSIRHAASVFTKTQHLVQIQGTTRTNWKLC